MLFGNEDRLTWCEVTVFRWEQLECTVDWKGNSKSQDLSSLRSWGAPNMSRPSCLLDVGRIVCIPTYPRKSSACTHLFFPCGRRRGGNNEISEKDSTPQVEFPTHPPVFPSNNSQVNEWNFREIKDQKLRTSMTPTTPWVLARMAVVQLVALAQQRWWKSNVPALTGIWGWKLEGQGWSVTGETGWWMLIMNYELWWWWLC